MKDDDKISITALHGSYIPPRQSADTLFHFIEKIEYLLPILERDALIPRYCVETIEYLKIPYKNIAYPMLCFCDINLHKIHEHVEFYGGYGIAFSKQWGITKGIQPVQYLNEHSPLCKDFSEAFKMAKESSYTDEAQNYLLSQMYFLKPIVGDMQRNGKGVHKNFTDECEWRFIPKVSSEEFPEVLLDNEIIRKDIFNSALAHADNTWLKFSVDDIKYLIVRNRADFQEVIKTILEKNGIENGTQHNLISKILVWDEVRGDF